MRLYQQEGYEGAASCKVRITRTSRLRARIFDNLFGDCGRFIVAFRRALPEIPADRAWRIHFCVGAMIHTMSDSEKLKRFSNGMCDPSDTEATIERMVQFCAADSGRGDRARSPGVGRDGGAWMRAAVATVLILVAAGGAAKLDQPARAFAVEPPAAWAAAPDPAEPVSADVDWWAYFGDAGLDGAISEALTRNKDLTAAAARIELAQAQARIAGAPLLPSLTAAVNRNRQRNNFIGLPIPGREDDVISSINTNVGLSNLSWEPFGAS
jgi:hypothetical protein